MGAVLRRLIRHRLALLGMIIVVLLLFAAAFAPKLSPHDPFKFSLRNKLLPPSATHPLGTDELGRDILSRILFGTRYSLLMAVISVAMGLVVGTVVGAVSGYYYGWVDILVQRLVDILLAFPGILLAIVVVAILGPGLWNAMIAVGISFVPHYVRIMRASVLEIREKEFVEAARAQGAGDLAIIIRHVLPNCIAPIIVLSTLQMASAILWASGLGYLGLGAQPPTPEWGTMLGRSQVYLRVAPYVAIFPGLAIALAVLGFNLLGDGLRDSLDPKLRGRL